MVFGPLPDDAEQQCGERLGVEALVGSELQSGLAHEAQITANHEVA